METVVIIFLLMTGSLCIVAQGVISMFHARAAASEAAARASSDSAARSKPGAKSGAKSSTASAADDANDEGEPTESRVLGTVSRALGARSVESARIGLLGIALMLVAVTLVLDISFMVGVSTP